MYQVLIIESFMYQVLIIELFMYQVSYVLTIELYQRLLTVLSFVGGCIDNSKVCDGVVDCPYSPKSMLKCMNAECPEEDYNDEQNTDFVCSKYLHILMCL